MDDDNEKIASRSVREILHGPPVEVFEAALGNKKPLIDLLRSDKPRSMYTEEAIAVWLEGELPAIRPRGRPHGTRFDRLFRSVGMKLALAEYKRRYKAIGRPRGQADRIAEEVANDRGIDVEKFMNYRHRAKSQRHTVPEKLETIQQMYQDWLSQR